MLQSYATLASIALREFLDYYACHRSFSVRSSVARSTLSCRWSAGQSVQRLQTTCEYRDFSKCKLRKISRKPQILSSSSITYQTHSFNIGKVCEWMFDYLQIPEGLSALSTVASNTKKSYERTNGACAAMRRHSRTGKLSKPSERESRKLVKPGDSGWEKQIAASLSPPDSESSLHIRFPAYKMTLDYTSPSTITTNQKTARIVRISKTRLRMDPE